ncbi:MAG TPA: methyl-accepting chemotaxis protein [Termitinemataceae bacterium]|nr:methyl-accepting chemotaxis protein [Termitinemataceae bacterium]HOM23669.1 methyl-accepting chemotaxis protein [Termitinemataceae bacterium]HPP99410.1 methyl-accepting chemotaxis protein [Termitinemataceae bacterium]
MKLTIQKRMYLFLLLPVFVILCGVGFISYHTTLQADSRLITDYMKHIAEHVQENTDAFFSAYIERALHLARNPFIVNMDIERIIPYLAQEKALDENMVALFIGLPDGNVIYSDGNRTNLAEQDYYKQIFQGKKPFVVSNPLISKSTGRPVIVVGAGIYEKGAATPKGIIAFSLDLQKLSAITELNLGEGIYSFLADNNGTIVVHPNTGFVMKLNLLSSEQEGFRGLEPLAQRMVAGEEGIGRYVDNQGVKKILFFRPLKNLSGWSFAIVLPEYVLVRSAQGVMWSVVLSYSGLAVLLGVLIFIVSRFISRSAQDARHAVVDLARGEGDLTRRIHVRSRDELGEMAEHINKFLDLVHTIVVSIRTIVKDMRLLGEELQSNTVESAASAKQIAANTKHIQDQLISQSAGVSETLATVEQINRNIQSFLQMIETQANNLSQASSAVEEMVANIASVAQSINRNQETLQNLVRDSDQGKELLNTVESVIHEIEKASEGMMEANTIIATIASQTNLLSMNAAIEAAHAGEAGKGFAVVAEEIRKLAENANDQSKSIAQVLQNVKTLVDQAVQSTTEAQNKIDSVFVGIKRVENQELEVKHAMDEQQEGSQQVLEAMKELNHITSEIRSGSEEIRIGSQTILEEMGRLMKGTQDIEEATHEMARGSEEIAQAMEHISGLTSKNTEVLHRLDSLVAKFRVELGEKHTE